MSAASLRRLVLWIAAVAFAGFGLLFIVVPNRTAAMVDIQLISHTGVTDFVATYGGFEIGFAVFLFTCLRGDDRVRIGLMASGYAVAGFALTRAAAIVAFGDVKPVLYRALVFEAVCATVAFWAARR